MSAYPTGDPPAGAHDTMTPIQLNRLSDLRFEQQLGDLTAAEHRELAELESQRSCMDADRRARLRFAAAGEFVAATIRGSL